MSDPVWYDSVTGQVIEQGDLFSECVVRWVGQSERVIPNPDSTHLVVVQEHLVRCRTFDIIVLSQTCDLRNDKVSQVLVARTVPWPQFVEANSTANPFVKSTEFRRKLVEGSLPSYVLLSRHTDDPQMPWTIVDFHQLYVIPKSDLMSQAAERPKRLRLRSPYLEHLSQAFARYFMRVGLPQPLGDFIKDGK
jgi:hypothetical protein